MIASIKTWMFNKSLKEHSNFNLDKGFSGVNHCESFCIISSDNAVSFPATEKFKNRLEGYGKKVEVLYFLDDKSESEKGYSRQNVKWNGVPHHEIIDAILSKEYDLLIFLNPQIENHLKYLAILCNAKFKIGPAFTDAAHIFDLMIELNDVSNTALLITEIEKQLKLIST